MTLRRVICGACVVLAVASCGSTESSSDPDAAVGIETTDAAARHPADGSDAAAGDDATVGDDQGTGDDAGTTEDATARADASNGTDASTGGDSGPGVDSGTPDAAGPCVPSCAGRTCGANSCGQSSCGTCLAGQTCVSGACEGTATPPKAACDYTGQSGTRQAFCSCTATAGAGSATYSGHQCGEDDVGSEICCASNGFPNGGSCNCYEKGAWACHSYGSTLCACDFDETGANDTCNNLPGPDHQPWACCLDRVDGGCSCGEGLSCGAGTQVVSTCQSATALGLTQPYTSCPSGAQVTSCSQNLKGTCVNNDDCPGGVTGTDPVCSFSCNTSKHLCQECCISSGGSSACF